MKEIYVRTKLVNGTYVYAPKGTANTYGTVLIDNETLQYNGNKLEVNAEVLNGKLNQDTLNKLQAIENKVENIANAYVIDAEKTYNFAEYNKYKKSDDTIFNSQEELVKYLGTNAWSLNNLFKSSNDQIALHFKSNIETDINNYIICEEYEYYKIYKISDLIDKINIGDNFYVKQQNIPDRWVESFSSYTAGATIILNAYESKKQVTNLIDGTGVGSLKQLTKSSSGTPYNNEASGSGAVAFGKDTKSKGNSSFVTGQKNTATENASRGFVGGYDNTIDNATTFAFGQGLKNSRERKASFGQWNKDEYDTLFEVGCGTSDEDRRNAFEVRDNGVVIMKERAKVYGEPQDPTDVIRKQDLDKPYELIEEITLTEDTAKIDRAGYNLKDVYIYVNAPRYTDTHGITFVVNGGSAISCSDVINKNFNAISALYASIKGNLLFMGYTQNTNSDSNAFNYKQRIPVVNIPRINRLTFQQDVGKVMPAGIVIKIYGR